MSNTIKEEKRALFRILIASDIHLGYNERHHERGEDSFRAFEEVLSKAREEDVDLILLGGDLFHFNKPTIPTFQKTVELLRAYCLGSRPIQFKIVSNQSDNFSHYNNFKHANYLDENLNISMPVFTIHGNHDDPTGANHVSSVDLLSSAGLINYFGKYTNVDEILLSPILLQKGNCKIALYGLGSVNEERLYRIVTDGKLNYSMPETDEDEWFKIVVVHQNRVKHGNTKYLPERFLSQLPNLVIWGHEHESKTEPDWNEAEEFFVYQPGSTVATSLCEAEAGPKHYGILEVFYDEIEKVPKFQINIKKLKTVRPFIWESIDVNDLIKKGQIEPNEDSIESFCKQKIEDMIRTAKLEHTGDCRQPKLPLIRLRLEFTDDSQQLHSGKFGANFNGRVANHTDVISCVKRRSDRRYDASEGNVDLSEIRNLMDQEVISERVNIANIIKEYFGNLKDPKQKLGLLSDSALTVAVIDLVEKDNQESIGDVFEAQKDKMKDLLNELQDLKVEDIRDEIKRLKSQLINVESQDLARILAESRVKNNKSVKTEPNISNDLNDSDMSQTMDSDEEQLKVQSSGRGRARGRGRGGGRRATKRATQTRLDMFVQQSSSNSNAINPKRSKNLTQELVEMTDSD